MEPTEASLVDEELAALLVLADEGDSSENWLALCRTSGPGAALGSINSFTHSADDAESLVSPLSSVDRDMEGGLQTGKAVSVRLDQRRRQQRESAARSRKLRRQSAETLIAQAAALEHVLQRVLIHKKHIYVHGERLTSIQVVQARYIDAVRAREALQDEIQRLSTTLHQQEQRALALHRLVLPLRPFESLDTIYRAPDTRSASNRSTHTNASTHRWLYFRQSESPLLYELLDKKVCGEIADQSHRAIRSIRQSLASPSQELLSTCCLGWRVERTLEIDSVSGQRFLQMRCVKRIPRSRISLQELQDKTWEFMSTPELVEQATDGNTSAVVAQQVDDDTIVLLRNSRDAKSDKMLRCFRMTTRMWSTNGSAQILLVVLDKEAQEQDTLIEDGRVQWMKHGFSCGHFSYDGDDHIQLEYIGSFECLSEAHAAGLLVTNCLSILKWETFAVPSRLLA